jgi:hypothetical protein
MHPVGHKRPGLGVNLDFSIGVIIDVCVYQQYVKFDLSYGGRSDVRDTIGYFFMLTR